MRVRFSELARAGMARLMDDESRRKSLEHSIMFYLRSRGRAEYRRCPAFNDVDLYIYPIWTWQVLFEIRDDEFFVWAVSLQAAPM